MKRNNNFELKLYELLGVRIFRKFIFFLLNMLISLCFFWKDKSIIKQALYQTPTNYTIRKSGNILENLKDFKWALLFNASVHILVLVKLFPDVLNIISGNVSYSYMIDTFLAVMINLYCVMLQRYNHIRINEAIKKAYVREQRLKNIISNEIEKKHSVSRNEVKIKIVDKKTGETKMRLNDFLQCATVEQLKKYKEFLCQYDKCGLCNKMEIPFERGKILKLEMKRH